MINGGVTWVLLADGRRARVLVEAKRGGAVAEQAAWEISEDELYDPRDRPPRSYDSAGVGRHAMDGGVDLHEEEEKKFLKRVAGELSDACQAHAFDHLVIAAPPRALGLLRSALPDAVRRKIQTETAKDLLSETGEAVRARLKEWRLPG